MLFALTLIRLCLPLTRKAHVLIPLNLTVFLTLSLCLSFVAFHGWMSPALVLCPLLLKSDAGTGFVCYWLPLNFSCICVCCGRMPGLEICVHCGKVLVFFFFIYGFLWYIESYSVGCVIGNYIWYDYIMRIILFYYI